jgi:hypothetical protein
MNTSTTQKLWQTISECKDIPEEITEEIRRGFETHNRATELWNTKRKTMQQITNDLSEAQRQAVPKLFAELSAGKKNSLHQSTEQIVLLTHAQTEAQLAERFTSQAMRRAESAISSPLQKHRDTFIQWVAQRRIIEPYACGFTEQVTPEVLQIWVALNVPMYPRLDENLELPTLYGLPVIFEVGWSQKHRSSLAWIWQQIAQGNFDYVPQPNDRQGNTRTLRITAFANNIPQAPATPTRRSP